MQDEQRVSIDEPASPACRYTTLPQNIDITLTQERWSHKDRVAWLSDVQGKLICSRTINYNRTCPILRNGTHVCPAWNVVLEISPRWSLLAGWWLGESLKPWLLPLSTFFMVLQMGHDRVDFIGGRTQRKWWSSDIGCDTNAHTIEWGISDTGWSLLGCLLSNILYNLNIGNKFHQLHLGYL